MENYSKLLWYHVCIYVGEIIDTEYVASGVCEPKTAVSDYVKL